MDHNHNGEHGHVALAVSLITGFFAWIGGQSMGEALKVISGVVSIGAGLMAIRYYYFATKKHK